MADLSAAASFLPSGGEERVAVYRKEQTCSKPFTLCDSCGEAVQEGALYVRIQVVNERKGENLDDRWQARTVDYQRRVILKYHRDCEPEGFQPDPRRKP